MNVPRIISWLIEAYVALVVARVIASWIPSAGRYRAVHLLGKLTEPYLRLFRFIPPAGGLDFSPVVAILLLQALASWVRTLPY